MYVVCTQKNRLNGSFEEPQHMFKLMDKEKVTQFYA